MRQTLYRLASQPARAATNGFRDVYAPFIAGQVVNGDSELIPVENPATGKVLCSVRSATSEEVRGAVESAHAAFQSGIWSRSAPARRARVLTDVARALERRLPDLIALESLQTGRCIREMRAQLGRVPEWLDYAAAVIRTYEGRILPTQGKLLNYTKRVPLGVVAQITPFNHPLLIAMKKIAPALAAGNCVIVKPSELAPVSVLLFAEIATEAGIPPSVLSVLPGSGATVGKELVSHELIKKVDITAGTGTGKVIGRITGERLTHFTAELGGKAPILVFADADIPSAVAGVCFSAFVASGQTCVSGTRLLVQTQIYDQFLAALRDKVATIIRRIGSPQNPLSMMGPVISGRSLQKIQTAMAELPSTCSIVIGGQRLEGPSPLDGFDLSDGHFFPPTVVENVQVDDTLWAEELFGPVLAVNRFESEEDAIRLANSSRYALGGGLWTSDVGRAHRLADRLEAGIVWVNTWHRNDPSSPWGGMKDSGIGRENGIEAFEHYTQSKSTVVNIAPLEELRQDDWFAEEGSAPVRYG